MKAAVMWEAGGPFEVQDVDLAPPGPREVRVEVHACGVCASDLSLTTAFGQPTPVVLGHEGAGIVTGTGAEVERVAVGDRVVVVWVPPCGRCAPCRRGDEYLCANRRSSADARGGGGPGPPRSARAAGRCIRAWPPRPSPSRPCCRRTP